MDKQELLKEYTDSIKLLKKECTDAGMSEDEFRKLYFKSLESLESRKTSLKPNVFKYIRLHKYIILLILVIICVSYNYKAIYSNLQEYIYPGLRILRRVSIPFISLFPSLTEFYHETCLIQNPFFTVADMDCWPCSATNNIRDIPDPDPNQHHNAPFIYKTQQLVVNVKTLHEIYSKNNDLFDKESPKVLCNNKYYINPTEMFQNQEAIGEKNFYIWKFNTMNVARLLRQIIPRPKIVPRFGQSTERFLILDSSQNSFHIPDTECNYSFLLSLSGTRTIDLMPAMECKHQCKSLQVELKESYLLWYNWWYWRPVMQPSLGNDTFIAHVGSYC